MSAGIKKSQEKKLLSLLRRYKVSKASVFGSYARGEAVEGSDLDLLVKLPKDASLMDLAGLKVDLEESLGCGVDVLTYESIHPKLRRRILREQVAIL